MTDLALDPQHPSVPITVVECWQWAYKTCRHAELVPMPRKGQRYRVTGFLDVAGRCPTCQDERKAQKAGKR